MELTLEKPTNNLQTTLTSRQKSFIEAFITVKNATKAAVMAGYSRQSARQMGAENLSKPYIREIIDSRLTDVSVSIGYTPEKIKKELVRIAQEGTESGQLKALELLGKSQKMFTDVIKEGDTINLFNILPSINKKIEKINSEEVRAVVKEALLPSTDVDSRKTSTLSS